MGGIAAFYAWKRRTQRIVSYREEVRGSVGLRFIYEGEMAGNIHIVTDYMQYPRPRSECVFRA